MRITTTHVAIAVLVIGIPLAIVVFSYLDGSWTSAFWIVGNLIGAGVAFCFIVNPPIGAYLRWRGR